MFKLSVLAASVAALRVSEEDPLDADDKADAGKPVPAPPGKDDPNFEYKTYKRDQAIRDNAADAYVNGVENTMQNRIDKITTQVEKQITKSLVDDMCPSDGLTPTQLKFCQSFDGVHDWDAREHYLQDKATAEMSPILTCMCQTVIHGGCYDFDAESFDWNGFCADAKNDDVTGAALYGKHFGKGPLMSPWTNNWVPTMAQSQQYQMAQNIQSKQNMVSFAISMKGCGSTVPQTIDEVCN